MKDVDLDGAFEDFWRSEDEDGGGRRHATEDFASRPEFADSGRKLDPAASVASALDGEFEREGDLASGHLSMMDFFRRLRRSRRVG